MNQSSQTVADNTDTHADANKVSDDNKGKAPANEGTGAQDSDLDLDSLLNEYKEDPAEQPKKVEDKDSEDEDGKSADKVGQKSNPKMDKILSYVEGQMENEARQKTRADIDKAIEVVGDGLDLPKSLIEGELHRRGYNDRRFLSAFQKRHQNPETWNKVLKAVNSELRKELSGNKPAKNDSDKDRIASAVRNASTKPASSGAPDFSKMSDAEFMQWKQDHG